jgi:CTP synthase (UTP-ammonia lyase)
VDAIRIGVVGDYQDGNETHLALGPAADHAAERASSCAITTWVATPELDGAAERFLGDFDALWIAPGSPYRSMRGALEAIT